MHWNGFNNNRSSPSVVYTVVSHKYVPLFCMLAYPGENVVRLVYTYTMRYKFNSSTVLYYISTRYLAHNYDAAELKE